MQNLLISSSLLRVFLLQAERVVGLLDVREEVRDLLVLEDLALEELLVLALEEQTVGLELLVVDHLHQKDPGLLHDDH